MKILNLKVEGFRSLKSVDWSPGDLNVVIGPNAGGKSNLLQLLEMIAASACGKLSKFIKKQGGMQPLLWDGKAKNIKCNFTLLPRFADINAQTIYSLELARLGNSSSYVIHFEALKDEVHKYLYRTHSRATIFNNEDKRLDLPKKDISEEETILCTSKAPFASNALVVNQKKLASWSIYNEFDFNTGQDASVRQAMVTSYETCVEPDGQNFVAVLHTLYEENRDFKNEINNAMRAAFGDDFEELSFPPAADGRTQLRIRWKSLTTGQSAANLSDGTLRFLYLLTILANPEPPALIAIDEPETGLHPSMLSIIAEYAAEAARRTQVIFTTHSAEMLNAFSETRPTVTVCEWHDGQTELHVLAGEKLDYWLGKYSLGELYRTGELENMK